jgi:hypothetical protein
MRELWHPLAARAISDMATRPVLENAIKTSAGRSARCPIIFLPHHKNGDGGQISTAYG